MLEDDQKFEELESKLAALSSQVESLELENEDMFFEDDVRRVIDDFKSRELAGLESEGEDFDDDESTDSSDFISVQTTSGPSFKTHWIAPDSCEDMTRDLARDAFVQGAADRYGTSQQVNNGDVLILLCREPVAEEPEEGSEPEEPEPPKKICRYIGLAYNTLVHPGSTEPPNEDEELISAPVGNYEIFVWSSCECSEEPAETVEVLVSGDSSGDSDSDSNSYLKLGDDDSSIYDSGVLDFLTDVEVAKDNVENQYTSKGLTISKDIIKKTAGLYGGLNNISTKLTNWYVDYKKLKIKVKSDVGNLMSSPVQSGGSLSTKLLSAGECGNLTATDPEEPEVLSILAAGSGEDAQATKFNKNIEVSLGNVITFDVSELDAGPDAIPSTDLQFSELTTGDAAAAVNIFLPTISDSDAGKIVTAVGPLSFLSNYDVSIEARYSVIYESESEGDAEYRIYKKEASHSGLTFASGLLTGAGTASEDENKVLLGVIRVSAIPLTYGCDPIYGCQPDPAGKFFDSSCGSGCENEELILSYRPSNIWVYTESAYQNGEFCFNLESSHESIPAGADLQNQFYTNEGHLKAEKVGGEKVDNFYVNSDLIPENNIYYAEKDPYDVCNAVRFEHSFRRYRETTLDDGSGCWTFVSEHTYILGQGDDRTVICTNNGRVVSKLNAVGINVPEYQVNNLPIGQEFYVDSRPGDYNGISIPSTAPGNTDDPPLGECSETAQIEHQANGDTTPFDKTIVYPKTTAITDVSVTLTLDQYIGSGGGAGVYLSFTNSDGSKLESLESLPYRGTDNNNPLEFTTRIPAGSTSLKYEVQLAPEEFPPYEWDLHLTSQ